MAGFSRTALATLLALTLTACGAGHTVVISAPAAPLKAETVALAYEEATVKVPDAAVAKMSQALDKRFFAAKGARFRPGKDLVIKWGFIGYDPGSQFTRWFIGFGAGEAKMVVRAEFFDPAGTKLASIQADGSVSGGFFGGSSDDGLTEVADQIAKYAEANFHP